MWKSCLKHGTAEFHLIQFLLQLDIKKRKLKMPTRGSEATCAETRNRTLFFLPVKYCIYFVSWFAVLFIFITNKGSSNVYNIFVWLSLFMGNGVLMCLYSQEWYARQNCQSTTEILTFWVGRFCWGEGGGGLVWSTNLPLIIDKQECVLCVHDHKHV